MTVLSPEVRFPITSLQENLVASEHIKAIKHFYEETDDDYCMIVEDDVSFDIAGIGTLPGKNSLVLFLMIGTVSS